MSAAKIPKGWHELRVGTCIREGDRYWAWDKGPWMVETERDHNCEKKYRPANRFSAPADWTVIRKNRR